MVTCYREENDGECRWNTYIVEIWDLSIIKAEF